MFGNTTNMFWQNDIVPRNATVSRGGLDCGAGYRFETAAHTRTALCKLPVDAGKACTVDGTAQFDQQCRRCYPYPEQVMIAVGPRIGNAVGTLREIGPQNYNAFQPGFSALLLAGGDAALVSRARPRPGVAAAT